MQQQSSYPSEDGPSLNPESRIPNACSHFLLHATRMAERGLGRTWPNPTVGCVMVKDGHVLAATRTGDGGRPHAETQALAMAGHNARGATAYVTLEPCAHHGKTPPCAEALIDAGIARVVIGEADPDPRVNGQGIAMLEAANIEVTVLKMPEAARLNRGFFRRIQYNLPYVAMKLATSADHFMARGDGGGQWITGEFARQHGHLLRSQFDCMLTGIGTILADDALLTVRSPIAPHPTLVRVVADRRLGLPLKSKLVKTANQQPVWVITSAEAVEQAASHATELREAGVKFLVVEDKMLSPHTILTALTAEGITRTLIEAGPAFSRSFIAEGLIETLHWYRAPLTLGNAGKSPIDALDSSLAKATRTDTRNLGNDFYERFELS